MKRIVALVVVFLFAVAVSVHAQEPADRRVDPSKSSVSAAAGKSASMFSKASIEKAVAKAATTTPLTVPQTKKPFLKTPWPYVIAAAVIVILIFALRDTPQML